MPFLAIGGSIVGGLLQGNSARKAARTQAASQLETARLAAEESRFRPVGVTTRFGTSDFQFDPTTGRVSGANYSLDPALTGMQNRFMGLAEGGLTQAEQAQGQYAPLQGAAQGLFNLGQQYLAESPEQAAQKYMLSKQNLLAPSRERQYSQLQTGLFNTGRGGLSVGGTGLRPGGGEGLRAANPEMEAYYNAIAQQDAQIADQAMQAGQQQALFGADLYRTGGNLGNQMYGLQASALGPYQAYLSGATGLENLGQQALTMGTDLGRNIANPQGGQAMYQGGMGAADSMYKANTYNPFATALTGLSQNPALRNLTGSGLSSAAQAAFSQTALGGSGFGTGLAYNNRDLGAFL
jgi:hypothetical protein